MEIRREDVHAIVTAVEWIIDGNLTEVVVHREGTVVFSAHSEDSELVIDPEAMSPELARHLLEETSIFDEPSSPDQSAAEASEDTATEPADMSAEEPEPRPARA